MLADQAGDLKEAAATLWDAVIVGAGMGGATIGWALAREGWRVLFIEQGPDTAGGDAVAVLRGEYPEMQLGAGRRVPGALDAGLLRRAGRYSDVLIDASGRRPRTWVPFLGGGSGGSSALYGMVLERFQSSDFEPRAFHRPGHGAMTVDRWPVSFEEMLPFYEAAERLYRVSSIADPQSTWSQPVRRLVETLRSRGVHPYALPLACDRRPGCSSCQGFLCAADCKVDAARACLLPARRDFGAVLLADCRADRLLATSGRVSGVNVTRGEHRQLLRGRIVILAAGALRTPLLLLTSTCSAHPEGLANRSGLVGRLLMRHLIDLYMIEPAAGLAAEVDNRRKEFAFNDFYVTGEGKLGSVQSFGRLPPSPMLVSALAEDLRHGYTPPLAHAVKLARPLLEHELQKMVDRSIGLASQVEDLPYADNRILPHPSAGPAAVQMRYRVGPDDARRVQAMRTSMRKVLTGLRHRRLAQAANNQRIAHACGTCRFGEDPSKSVLDRFNRTHDLENLYVVDASFFPSSGGTNPSLTIAANALRVAHHLGASVSSEAPRS